ncbi:phage repressor protein/antirepressor Ant [Paenibacillus sambharensis]|uniref:Phage repressor protein/antirepressor Ant n=1 Tax=Paenibacillus sambharensis TaxID=1803190 RepID=A0A2W1LAP2_9BACL|nr:phage antirepressor [Paenibacillus sambharensis]PZD95200.1 phage repressor protein/antirepressor Ant [Paenibacillus sambharensis]
MSQLFEFSGRDLRVISKSGEPWFVLKDVCELLDLGQVAGVKRRLSEDVISNHPLETAGGKQTVTIINEDGLYDVILESRKPEAKTFRKWITSEVIPSIRKHGAYMTPETIEKAILNPDFIIGLATKLKSETARADRAEIQLDEQRPLVAFAETCMDSERNMLVREVAKLASKNGLLIGERRLYIKLREWGLVCQNSTEPTQRGMELGVFEVIKGVRQTPKGSRDWETTKVTPKGQAYIINRLRREAA